MSVVAKVGSLLTQGVYSVATPFHPFGGAVDIIVVQQPDDSFRSTPWYVRFGKFQGVLKGWEKIVRINVNEVEANFHMYLDNSGEAYFIREVDSSHDSESQAGRDGAQGNNRFNKDIKENFPARRLQSSLSDPGVPREDFPSFRPDGLDRAESDACKFYDFQDEQSSLEGSVELSAEYGSNRFDNLESAENFAEAQGPGSEMVLVSVDGHILMAPISSTEKQNTDDVELGTPQFHLGPGGSTEFCEGSRDFCVSESAWSAGYLTDLNAASSSKVNATDGSGADRQKEVSKGEADLCREQSADDAEGLKKCKEDQGSNNEQHEVDICEEVGKHIHQNQGTSNVEDPDRDLHVHNDVEDELAGGKTFERFQSCLKHKDFNQFSCQESLSAIQEELESPRESPQKGLEVSNDTESRNSGCLQSASDGEEQRVDEFQSNEEPQPPTPAADMEDPEAQKIATGVRNFGSEDTSVCDDDQSGVAQSVGAAQSRDRNDLEGECCASKIMEQKAGPGEEEQTSSGSRIEISLCGHLLRAGMGLSAAAEAFDDHRISKEEFKSSATSIIKSEKLIVRVRERYLTWDKAAPIVLGATAFDLDLPVEPGDVIPVQQEEKVNENDTGGVPTSGRKWRLWPIPFRSVKTLEHSNSSSSNEEVFVDPETPSQERSVERMSTSQNGTPSSDTGTKSSPRKKVVRTNIVTSEQIASLNLKDGQNIVTFSSTSLLGSQQVEAHIYLWKWNTRIVISDVDGTITKSDVLGQFMPLVGRDWSQSGVARLFCAIKENGYQLLFLSARAIVQAYLTKSFLFNLKQDGKTLPNGPVVISPDGLFPSLYREVIRRAPHEFKIPCLEDIKAVFPPDYNPFYAGFGNRDTDEFSYRKIGIPKGKIFIINPKGEVAINNRIDLRSYTSLHTLVNDMFPPTSMVEQEDYNAWNYWKVPLLDIDE